MSTYLNLPDVQLRVEMKNLVGVRGLGICQVAYDLELLVQSSSVEFAGTHLILGGQLYISFEKSGMAYVGQIHQSSSAVGTALTTTLNLCTDITLDQLKAIEAARGSGDVTLYINPHGTLIRPDGQPRAIFGQQMQFRVDEADWLKLLEQCGYGRRILLHEDGRSMADALRLDAPEIQ